MEKANIIREVNNYGEKVDWVFYNKLEKISSTIEIKSKIKELKEKIEELEFDNPEVMYDFDVSYLEEIEKKIDFNKTHTKAEIKIIKNDIVTTTTQIQSNSHNEYVLDDHWNEYYPWEPEYNYLTWVQNNQSEKYSENFDENERINIKLANDNLNIWESLVIDLNTYTKQSSWEVINMWNKIDNSQVENVHDNSINQNGDYVDQQIQDEPATQDEPKTQNPNINNTEQNNQNILFSNFQVKSISKGRNTNYEAVKDKFKEIHKKMYKLWEIDKSDIGVFWPKTWEFIYAYYPEYYLNSNDPKVKNRAQAIINLEKNKNKEFSDKEIKRYYTSILDMYNEDMYKVRDNKNIHPNMRNVSSYKKRIQSKKHFYWNIDWETKLTMPKQWTAIATWLENIPNRLSNLSKTNNVYVLKNKQNKFALYYFLWWELKIATYISPWAKLTLSTKVTNQKIRYDKNELVHFSWNDPKLDNWKWVWTIMPWSINIPKGPWEFAHSSLGTYSKWDFLWVNWTMASHWCTRMPPFYNSALLKYLKNLSSYITILDVN